MTTPTTWREHVPLIIIAVGLAAAIYMLYRDLNGLKQSISAQQQQQHVAYTPNMFDIASSESSSSSEEEESYENPSSVAEEESSGEQTAENSSVPSYDGRPVVTEVYDEPPASLVRSDTDKKVPVVE